MNDDSLLKEALDRLPHGPEFRFIDRLVALTPGRQGEGEYRVRGDEPFLAGHFPGDPMMPGVVLVEAAAQLAGVVAQCDPEAPPLEGLKLTALRGVKILGTARPGETLNLRAEVTGRMGHLIQAQATGRVGDRLVLEANITLGGQPPQS